MLKFGQFIQASKNWVFLIINCLGFSYLFIFIVYWGLLFTRVFVVNVS